MNRPRVAIVGGGILGMTAAYRLAQAGVAVSLYERSRDLGGLVGSFDLDGYDVDRFYHVVLPTDHRVKGLADDEEADVRGADAEDRVEASSIEERRAE